MMMNQKMFAEMNRKLQIRNRLYSLATKPAKTPRELLAKLLFKAAGRSTLESVFVNAKWR